MQEALEILEGQNIPGLVVLDLFIPAAKGGEESHVHGVTIISEIKRIREQGAPIKLLVITSHRESGKDYLALSKEWGVDGFYFKDAQTVDDLLMVSRVALEGPSETEVTRRLRQVLQQSQQEKRRLQDDVAILKSVSAKAIFPSIYGMDKMLMRISEEIIEPYVYWRESPDRFAADGMNFPSAVMLYGPPGTGKSEIAKTIKAFFEGGNSQEKEADISGSHPGFGSDRAGARPKIIDDAFKRVLKKVEKRRTIAVLIIDDIQIPRRDSSDDTAVRFELKLMTDAINVWVDRIVGINKEDKKAGKILIVLLSNYANPSQMDEATLDRFGERQFEILFPVDNRKAVFRQLIEEKRYTVSEELLAKLYKASSAINSGRRARGMVDKLITITAHREREYNPGQSERRITESDINKLLPTISSPVEDMQEDANPDEAIRKLVREEIQAIMPITLSHLGQPDSGATVHIPEDRIEQGKPLREILKREISLDRYLAEVEYECLKDALEHTEGSKTGTAKLLGISDHSGVIRRMEKVKKRLGVNFKPWPTFVSRSRNTRSFGG